MNRDIKKLEGEELLSSYIDDLNLERKPKIYDEPGLEEDGELLEIFETVRAVKRLRGAKCDVLTLEKTEKRMGVNIRKTVVAAAVLAIVFLAGSMFPRGPLDMTKEASPGNRELKLQEPSIVYAMETAYEELSGYSGRIEIITEENGVVESRDRIDVKFQKPDKFYFVHEYDKSRTVKISDGEKLYTIDGKQVTVDYVHPAKELWRFHIGNQINELKDAFDMQETGKETIAGREATVYEFRYSSEEPFNRIWIDDKTSLPLKQELNMNGGRRLTNIFTQIQFNPEFTKADFTYEAKLNEKVVMINKKASLEEAEKAWKGISQFKSLEKDGFKLNKVIKLEEGWYDYSLNFKNSETDEFVDIYVGKPLSEYYAKESELGKLGEGWIEINREAVNVFKVYIGKSTLVKWVIPSREIIMIGNTPAETMIKILETTSGEKVTPLGEEDAKRLGIGEVYTKPGH